MTTFKTKTISTGQNPNKSTFEWLPPKVLLALILTLPFRLLALFTKGYTEIADRPWEYFYIDDNIKIEKRQVAANGYDDCIPYYNLSSTDKRLNEIIRNKFFGDFICKVENGILLRQIKSPKNWPKSKLIYINFDNYKFEIIAKSNSAFIDWSYKFVEDQQIDIITEYDKSYNKVLRLTPIKIKH